MKASAAALSRVAVVISVRVRRLSGTWPETSATKLTRGFSTASRPSGWRNARRMSSVARRFERGSHRLLLIGEIGQLLPLCGDGLHLKDQAIIGGHVRRSDDCRRPGAIFLCGHHSKNPHSREITEAQRLGWPQLSADRAVPFGGFENACSEAFLTIINGP